MSIVGGRFPADKHIPPTEKQIEYAMKLAEIIEDRGLGYYCDEIENCDDRSEMSELIDEMKEELGFD